MTDRKGLTMESAIVGIIIFGVVMIVLVIIYKLLFGFAKMQFTKDECQASLLLTQASDKYVRPVCLTPVENPIPLKCNRDFMALQTKKVDFSPSGKLYTDACPKGYTGDNCFAKQVIADRMAACWGTFFQGEQIVFQQMEINSIHLFTRKDSKTACFVCSEITLKTDADIKDFKAYLQKAQYDKNDTYYDYLNNRGVWCAPEFSSDTGNSCWEGYAKKNSIDQDTLRKGQKYAVVFIRRGLATCDNEKQSETTITNQDVTFTVQVVPADNISQYCDNVIV